MTSPSIPFEGGGNANYGSELYYLADWQSLSLWGNGKGAQLFFYIYYKVFLYFQKKIIFEC